MTPCKIDRRCAPFFVLRTSHLSLILFGEGLVKRESNVTSERDVGVTPDDAVLTSLSGVMSRGSVTSSSPTTIRVEQANRSALT